MKRAPGSYAGLTAMQAALLSFLRTREMEGRTPSFEEMKDAVDLGSKSGVHRLLTALEERGYIERKQFRARCIRTFSEPRPFAADPDSINLASISLTALMREIGRRGVVLGPLS